MIKFNNWLFLFNPFRAEWDYELIEGYRHQWCCWAFHIYTLDPKIELSMEFVDGVISGKYTLHK